MDFIVESALQNMPEENFENMSQANIKVIGVGGAGNNMVGWLYKKGIKGAEIIATNTDHQHLGITGADRKFLIGKDCTRGLGCGGYPSKGAEAAQESMAMLKIVAQGRADIQEGRCKTSAKAFASVRKQVQAKG